MANNPTFEEYEMAAKAAGLTINTWSNSDAPIPWIEVPSFMERDAMRLVMWEPLYDDGDAFRLMVSVPLDVMRTEKDVEALASLGGAHVKIDAHTVAAPIELLGDDPAAATRMAIFRAAVEVGRALREREGGDG